MLVRWLSALVGIGIIISTTYLFGSQGIVALSAIVVLVCTIEFAFLFSSSKFWSAVFVATALFVSSVHTLKPEYSLAVLLLSFLFLSSKGLIFFSRKEAPTNYLNIEWSLWGIIYCGLLPALTLQLTLLMGWKVFYFLLITVFLGDSFALFTGSLVGGKKILPNISPKKTYSGAIGGLIGSCVFGVAFMHFASSQPINFAQWILICLTIGFFAQCGDFFESMLKRYSGKKDSSRLMPGHGGFLDRVDGVYFGSIVFYLYAQIYDLAPYFI